MTTHTTQAAAAIIYTRVSSEEQAKGYSLSTQEERCRAYAAQRGYTLAETFVDTESGELLERKALNRAFDYVAAHSVQVFIVFSVDRLSRGGPAHHAVIALRLEQYGVRIEYASEENEGSPEAQLSLMIRQSIAWYENRQRAERSVRGRVAAIQAGAVFFGTPPYGYTCAEGQLSVCEEEAAVVRLIFAWRLEGLSLQAIAKRLTASRLPTKKQQMPGLYKRADISWWSRGGVARVLANETYSGVCYQRKARYDRVDGKRRVRMRDRSEWLPVAVPAIIDAETFAAAQDVSERLRTRRKHAVIEDDLLRRRVRCVCGYRCTTTRDNGKPAYRCFASIPGLTVERCTLGFVSRVEVLDQAVWRAITGLLLEESNVREALHQTQAPAASARRALQERLGEIKAGLAEVEHGLNLLLDQMLEAAHSREVLQERKLLLLAERRRLLDEESQAQRQLAAVDISPTAEASLLATAATIRQAAADLTVQEKRRILELLNVEVHVVAMRQVRITCLLPLAEAYVELDRAQGGGLPISCTVDVTPATKPAADPSIGRQRGRKRAAPPQ